MADLFYDGTEDDVAEFGIKRLRQTGEVIKERPHETEESEGLDTGAAVEKNEKTEKDTGPGGANEFATNRRETVLYPGGR